MIKRNRYKLKDYLEDEWVVGRIIFALMIILLIVLIGFIHNLSVDQEPNSHQIKNAEEYTNGGD